MKAAGSRNLYLLVTRQPPTIVAALLANVNCRIQRRRVTHTIDHYNYVLLTLKNHRTGSVTEKIFLGILVK